MNVLIYCPTYRKADGALALRAETRKSLDALKHGRHKVTLEIAVDAGENRRENIFRTYQRAWEMARDGTYDALLIVEHDMIVPADALVKLAACEADVAYGVYLFRESGVLNALMEGTDVFFDGSLDYHPQERKAAFEAAAPYPVQGAGFGCTLVRRAVIEALELRVPKSGSFPDLPLAEDAKAAGFRQAAHFGVICGHIRPDGFVLWPNPEHPGPNPYTLPCQALSSFAGEWGGKRRFISAGTVLEIPAFTAAQLASLGLAKMYPNSEE